MQACSRAARTPRSTPPPSLPLPLALARAAWVRRTLMRSSPVTSTAPSQSTLSLRSSRWVGQRACVSGWGGWVGWMEWGAAGVEAPPALPERARTRPPPPPSGRARLCCFCRANSRCSTCSRPMLCTTSRCVRVCACACVRACACLCVLRRVCVLFMRTAAGGAASGQRAARSSGGRAPPLPPLSHLPTTPSALPPTPLPPPAGWVLPGDGLCGGAAVVLRARGACLSGVHCTMRK